MNLFDLLIAPYQREVLHVDGKTDSAHFMSPVKIFEYMATGIPMITSRVSAIKEILDEHEAILCNPDKKEEWRSAIVRCKNDQAYARRLGQNGLKKLTNQFTWEMRVKRIMTFLS
jgi:glycosyltransferase involved in cell wall biosynthesis